MQRRKMLAALGSVAVGGATAVSTGAFTSVSAERSVSVSVADDSQALLALDGSSGDNSAYSDVSGGVVSVDLDINDTENGGAGVNKGATTRIFEMFNIQNQGTQDAVVYVSPTDLDDQGAFEEGDDGIYLDPQFSSPANGTGASNLGELADGTKYGSLTGIGGNVLDKTTYNSFEAAFLADADYPDYKEAFVLGPGDSFDFGLYVRTNDQVSTGDFNFDIDLIADAQLAKKAADDGVISIS